MQGMCLGGDPMDRFSSLMSPMWTPYYAAVSFCMSQTDLFEISPGCIDLGVVDLITKGNLGVVTFSVPPACALLLWSFFSYLSLPFVS